MPIDEIKAGDAELERIGKAARQFLADRGEIGWSEVKVAAFTREYTRELRRERDEWKAEWETTKAFYDDEQKQLEQMRLRAEAAERQIARGGKIQKVEDSKS